MSTREGRSGNSCTAGVQKFYKNIGAIRKLPERWQIRRVTLQNAVARNDLASGICTPLLSTAHILFIFTFISINNCLNLNEGGFLFFGGGGGGSAPQERRSFDNNGCETPKTCSPHVRVCVEWIAKKSKSSKRMTKEQMMELCATRH
jgi:hypothetical protein